VHGARPAATTDSCGPPSRGSPPDGRSWPTLWRNRANIGYVGERTRPVRTPISSARRSPS
jgi:hypothetical protein